MDPHAMNMQKPSDPPAIALSGNNAQRTLWIGDVPLDWSEEELKAIFTECEHPPYKVKRVVLNNEKQGYCFIEFTCNEHARSALYDLNGNRIPGKGRLRFNLCFSNDSYNPNSEFNLQVSNLPTDFSDAQLYRIFDKYQSCRGAKMFRFNDGSTKGCGFVRFGDQTDQQMALVEMHKTKVNSHRIILKLAGQRGERGERPMNSFNGNDKRKEPRNGRSAKHFINPAADQLKLAGPPKDLVEHYGTNNPWALQPDEHDLDPLVGLHFLVSKNRPHVTNKRYMIESECLFNDLESSRWSTVAININETEDNLDTKLSANKWSIVN